MLSLMALVSASPEREAKSLSARYFSFSSLGWPSRPLVYAGLTTGSASSQILPTGSLKAPSPYTMTSICLPVALRRLCASASTKLRQSRGNSFTLSSVALFEPSRPNCSLYPLPFTGAVIRSLSSSTFSAPAASRRRLERSRVWMSQHSTFFVYGSTARTSFPNRNTGSQPSARNRSP